MRWETENCLELGHSLLLCIADLCSMIMQKFLVLKRLYLILTQESNSLVCILTDLCTSLLLKINRTLHKIHLGLKEFSPRCGTKHSIAAFYTKVSWWTCVRWCCGPYAGLCVECAMKALHCCDLSSLHHWGTLIWAVGLLLHLSIKIWISVQACCVWALLLGEGWLACYHFASFIFQQCLMQSYTTYILVIMSLSLSTGVYHFTALHHH